MQFFVVSKVVVHTTAILGTKCGLYIRISIYYASFIAAGLFAVVGVVLNDRVRAVKLLCQQHAYEGMGQGELGKTP